MILNAGTLPPLCLDRSSGSEHRVARYSIERKISYSHSVEKALASLFDMLRSAVPPASRTPLPRQSVGQSCGNTQFTNTVVGRRIYQERLEVAQIGVSPTYRL
jgi:hypothetical protein